jgi:hypothetical protein
MVSVGIPFVRFMFVRHEQIRRGDTVSTLSVSGKKTGISSSEKCHWARRDRLYGDCVPVCNM